MPRTTCTPCVAPKVRALLDEAFPVLRPQLAQLPNCPEGELLALCGRIARARTPRQEFMSSCLKGQKIKGFADAPRAMKACSVQWREKQGKTGA